MERERERTSAWLAEAKSRITTATTIESEGRLCSANPWHRSMASSRVCHFHADKDGCTSHDRSTGHYLGCFCCINSPNRIQASPFSCYNRWVGSRLKGEGGHGFAVAPPELLNSLPFSIKCSTSIGTFKLETFMFSQVFTLILLPLTLVNPICFNVLYEWTWFGKQVA